MTLEHVTVWEHGPREQQWALHEFQRMASHGDLVRTSYRAYVGSGPGKEDMQVDTVLTSEPGPDGKMIDTFIQYDADGHPIPGTREREFADPVFLTDYLKSATKYTIRVEQADRDL